MVRLTEEMVVARTRVSDCAAVKKLNCWGTELSDVSILRRMTRVEVLSLSVNNIKSLVDFQHCKDLKDLFVRKNNISDLNEVCYLQNLPNLRNLWLGENPCANVEGYRMTVLRALPKLEKLDDKVVTSEEVQTALTKGKVLTHPLDNGVQESEVIYSARISPEDDSARYGEDPDTDQKVHYSSSDEQCNEPSYEEYQENDKKNANYNTSPVQYPSNNRFTHEQNGQTKQTDYNIHNSLKDDLISTNLLEPHQQEYIERVVPSKNNGDYEDSNQRPYANNSQRVPYQPQVEYDDRRCEYDESLRPISAQSRRAFVSQRSGERDDNVQSAWMKRNEKDKRRMHFQPQYQRRPVTRNSNILSAVLCLVKELDYPSLEVVEIAIRNQMDELEE